MQRLMSPLMLAGFLTLIGTSATEAQMFGSRSFGQPLQPQANSGGGSFGGATPAPGIGSGAGNVPPSVTGISSGDARFMRKNRNAGDFVGKDTKDARKMVGAVQVGQGINGQPAALEVFERRVPENLLNPPRTPALRTRMYEPKLTIGFRPNPRPVSLVSANLQNQLNSLSDLNPSIQVSMTVTGETVHLQGVVSSEEERALIEQLMLFEPGISAVQNDLRVPAVAPLVPFAK